MLRHVSQQSFVRSARWLSTSVLGATVEASWSWQIRTGFATKSATKTFSIPKRNRFKTERKVFRKKGEQQQNVEIQVAREHEYLRDEIERFRYAAQEGDIFKVIDQYPRLLEAGALGHADSISIARCIHYNIRKASATKRRMPASESNTLIDDLKDFVSHYQSGHLKWNARAVVHILGAFRDADRFYDGRKFWVWAKEHHRDLLDAQTYGVAIDVLVHAPGGSLEVCEQTFQDGLALASAAGVTNAYLMSSGSVLTDPEQPSIVKGTSLSLLQGIMTARLVHNDWKGAYLALDTALKLHPFQIPSGVLRQFFNHRPLEETLKVFRLYCRSGNIVPPSLLSSFLGQLRSLAMSRDDNYGIAELILHVATYGVISGRTLEDGHWNVLIAAALEATPSPLDVEPHQTEDAQRMGVEVLFKILSILKSQGRHFSPPIATIIAEKAGVRGHKGLIARIVSEYFETTSDVTPGLIATFLMSMAKAGTPEEVVSLWRTICGYYSDYEVDIKIWNVLIRAVIAAGGDPQTVYDLLDAQENVDHGHIRNSLEQYANSNRSKPLIEARADHPIPSFASAKRFLQSLEEVEQKLRHGGQNKTIKGMDSDWSFSMAVNQPQFPETWYQNLYTDIHLKPIGQKFKHNAAPPEPTSEESPKDITSAVSNTGLSLGEIRYENWKGITELLLLAEGFESRNAYHKEQKSGETVRTRSLVNEPSHGAKREILARQIKLYRLAGEHKKNMRTEKTWREAVLQLRTAENETLQQAPGI